MIYQVIKSEMARGTDGELEIGAPRNLRRACEGARGPARRAWAHPMACKSRPRGLPGAPQGPRRAHGPSAPSEAPSGLRGPQRASGVTLQGLGQAPRQHPGASPGACLGGLPRHSTEHAEAASKPAPRAANGTFGGTDIRTAWTLAPEAGVLFGRKVRNVIARDGPADQCGFAPRVPIEVRNAHVLGVGSDHSTAGQGP